MSDSIWVVVNAGGNSRENEIADEFNAIACLILTLQRCFDRADILAEGRKPAIGPYSQSRKLGVGDRIAMLQGGGKLWRPQYGSGELIACGHIREGARPLMQKDKVDYNVLYEVTRKYFPPAKQGNKLVGILCYSVHRAKRRLPIGAVQVRPRQGQKFINVSPSDPGYDRLNKWWNDNCQGQDIVSG